MISTEQMWVKQLFNLSYLELKLAKITLEGDFGKIVIKAVVKSVEVSQGF